MIDKLKFAFFGTPEFAAIVLEKLIKTDWLPALVVSNPDRPVGRKKIITPPPTKVLAQKYDIKVLQPETLVNFEIRNSKFEFFIVASYAKIIPKEILEIPRLGTIGVHPSLLPKYRGPSPIQNAILNNETETGVTLFLLDEKVDHGSIIATRKLEILNSNFEILNKKLAECGGDLLVETLPKFLKGEIIPRPQDENKATYTKKFTIEDAYVDLEILRQAQDGASPEDAILIERKIRALNPEPGIWTFWQGGKPFDAAQGKRMKILEAELTSDNKLKLKKIQFEGKKPQVLF